MEESAKETNNMNVVIMGGGPAGLTAAYELSKKHIKATVLEKDKVVGGISRTVNYKNYLFDIGGHRFFTKISAVNKIWKDVLGNNFLRRKRLSRIYFNKKFFYYPLRPFNALYGLGIWNCFLILFSYLYAHLFPSKMEDNFEQWVSNRFGKRLYQIFFKTYTEKVWGISCREIRAEWAAQRIKGLSLMSALKNSITKPQNNDRKERIIKTLIDEFDYPKYGPGMLWEAISEYVQKKGTQVCRNTKVVGILCNNYKIDSIEVRQNGQNRLIHGSHFISSLPLRELIQIFKPSVPEKILNASNQLNYRDFITIVLIVNKRNIFNDNWIYIHDQDVKLSRIQNFKNWSPYMVPDKNKTCLGLEYFCFEEDELWATSDQDLFELGKRELEALGLAQGCDVEDHTVFRMPKAYPVYDSKYRNALKIIRQFLSKIDNIQVVGRNGMHKYNNQDHSMLTAMYAVENILGKNHNLWEVNESQEYHEKDKIGMPDELILQAFTKMDKSAFAIATGSVSGLLIFTATIWLVLKGGEVVGPNLQLLSQYFIGYSVTVTGAFIGAAYGILCGGTFGWLLAYMRNLSISFFINRIKKKEELSSFRDFSEHF
ncbi:protoporphyrinogen oxidase [Candidatus Scalindua japonica]|uniref:Protoporphyrinogen oxidase n=1 Tax=Candidatus Scalindua japonica TaxID=1284222 RepID=A0A286TX48_9BACT|nr:NAD(P)/FAD-dependent oxidoreductase [Candidatus Scalindua japonica]GAX60453.1 protoporphyrinogen oxidase [Candidatus Scalindua japonica]